MKRLLALYVLLFPLASWAGEDRMDVCSTVSTLAETVMRARQQGFPMRRVVEILTKDVPDDNQQLQELMVGMARAAYSVPRFTTEVHQRRAVEDFRDKLYLECTGGRE